MKDLLLLHGAIGAKSQFNSIAKELQTHFKIHCINFSGHGGNPIPEKYSIELFANDVLSYLVTNNIKSINIFGYSMGGYVALYLAKFHPEKVSRIYTFGTKYEWDNEIAAKEIKMLNYHVIEMKLPEFALQLKERHQPEDWRLVVEKTAAMIFDLGQRKILCEVDLQEIFHKIQIGVGDKDTMVSLQESISAFKSLSNSNLHVMPETHHPIEKIDAKRLAFEIKIFFRN